MKIGVYRFSALGDIAASIPVLRAFEHKPLILTSVVGRELLKDEFENIIVLEGKGFKDIVRFIYRLKKEKISLFVDLQNNDRSKFIRFFFDNVTNDGVSFEQSVTHIFYDIAKKTKMVQPLDITYIKKEPTYIVLNTGSSPKWISKRLPLYKWKEFSEVLYERFHLPFILTGDSNEKEYVQEVAKHIVGKKEVIAGKTSIQDLKQVLKDAYLCISTDSAPMHIAAVQKTPTIGIFGATNWIISAPFGPWSTALWDEQRFQSPPKKNLLKVGNYYDNIDIEKGLKKIENFL
ncbi:MULTISPECIES: glycosyltransferase family 9 protein [unclassified Nitratiruptor]|uniref:glycosyltransferase family 9 protein n=1 Tax=unclassified Nitratiruptor TaxID=2624044 RepID=UPI0019156E8E|nr:MULTISPECIES: glycosyltransferase family 9 protein [unclassified Nitratiruptor]BCD60740.1 ADP-heptose:LPS heptosyltransferase II [Nitratiruptor sp. YY08-10]BCD64672.1 ADP-heptose:LPS heptosyltransferase II [Nitratiruptor sp. YY08-14]